MAFFGGELARMQGYADGRHARIHARVKLCRRRIGLWVFMAATRRRDRGLCARHGAQPRAWIRQVALPDARVRLPIGTNISAVDQVTVTHGSRSHSLRR